MVSPLVHTAEHLRKEAGSYFKRKKSQLLFDVSFKQRETAPWQRRRRRSSVSRAAVAVFSAAARGGISRIRTMTRDSLAQQTLETGSAPLSTLAMPSLSEHQHGASCPGSNPPPVMTGWRCWQGSAAPTTPPGLWARSSSSQHWGSSRCTEQAPGRQTALRRPRRPASAPPPATLHTQI